jgi:putative aldouronate transport system substrate-binding protein
MLLLAFALVVGWVLAGCSGGKSEGPNTGSNNGNPNADSEAGQTEMDISKKVDLKMYLIGSPARDYDMVLEEVNKKLIEDINATVAVEWIGWSDFNTQYPLILASGEPIDLIYASNWTNFYANARKGAYLAIEELAKIYAPKSLAQITPDFYKQTEVDGHLYAMPAQFYQYGDMGYIVRGDLMDKYGIESINNMDDFGKYLDAIVKNEPELNPTAENSSSGGLDAYHAHALGYYNVLQNLALPYYIDMDAGDHHIFNLYETDGILDYFMKMKEWGEKGYWSKSILSNKEDNMFRDGKAASRLHNQDGINGVYMQHPEWDPRFYPNAKYTYKTAAMQDGMAIPASSKNPERALMFLELLRTDESYYDLFTYGIRGVHYDVTEDNKLIALDIDGFAPEAYCSWGFKSPEFYKEPVDNSPYMKEIRQELEKRAKENPYTLFVPDLDPVKNEIAAVGNVIQQYARPLSYGYIKNPEEGLNTLRSQLKAAGSDKVIAELQKQLDEFLANNH